MCAVESDCAESLVRALIGIGELKTKKKRGFAGV